MHRLPKQTIPQPGNSQYPLRRHPPATHFRLPRWARPPPIPAALRPDPAPPARRPRARTPAAAIHPGHASPDHPETGAWFRTARDDPGHRGDRSLRSSRGPRAPSRSATRPSPRGCLRCRPASPAGARPRWPAFPSRRASTWEASRGSGAPGSAACAGDFENASPTPAARAPGHRRPSCFAASRATPSPRCYRIVHRLRTACAYRKVASAAPRIKARFPARVLPRYRSSTFKFKKG
ncbi:hypothetical protein D3C85_1226060 [compost metagenome]